MVTICCARFGDVNPPVDDGNAADLPLSNVVVNVSVAMGGVNTGKPPFAGLTPSLVGPNQVDVVVPKASSHGERVPVQITVSRQSSVVAPMSVQYALWINQLIEARIL